MKLNGFNNDADSFEIETDDGNLIIVNDITYNPICKNEYQMLINIEHIDTSIWDDVLDEFINFKMDDTIIQELEETMSEYYSWEEYTAEMRDWQDDMNFEAYRERGE